MSAGIFQQIIYISGDGFYVVVVATWTKINWILRTLIVDALKATENGQQKKEKREKVKETH